MQYEVMSKVNKKYIDYVKGNFEESKKSSDRSLGYLRGSTAKYQGNVISSLHIPKLFPEHVVEYLDSSVNTMYSILEKVIKEYLNNADYRKLFEFDQRLEELILVDRGYDSYLPMCRLDIFLNEDDLSFKFCEFNSDGTSSMNEDRELNIALTYTSLYDKIKEDYKPDSFELFDSWVKEFTTIYSTYKKKVDKPHIGIVDFLEKGSSMEEFNHFKKSFEKAGYTCEVCEIRDLKYQDKALYSPSGKKLNAIYRRAVTSDIMANFDEVKDLIDAVKDENICLVGSFCTQVIHNKIVFKILHDTETLNLLTEEERQFISRHVPYTSRLTKSECNIEEVLNNKDKWIIKPEDFYGAKGVYAGITHDHNEWTKLVNENIDNHYLLQEFVMPYQSENINFGEEKPEFKNYSNLTGLYVYNGKFKGIYTRQSKKEIISTQYDENVSASLILKNKKEI